MLVAVHVFGNGLVDMVNQFTGRGLRVFVDGLQQAVVAEQLVVAVFGFGHTVGVEENAVAAV